MFKKLKELFNVRKFPHPERGNYLGANKRCNSEKVEKIEGVCPIAVDEMDMVGEMHDYDTKNPDDPWADFKFAGRMLSINPFNKYNYDWDYPVEFMGKEYNIDPRVYQYGSALVMGLLGLISSPVRLAKKYLML